jgi:hypothetical protein
MLTREQILKAQELKTETVNAPEWGGDVIIRELTSAERLDYFAALSRFADVADDRGRNLLNTALFVCRVVVDDKGNRLFTDDDAELLAAKNEKTLERVANKAAILNRIIAPEDIAGN